MEKRNLRVVKWLGTTPAVAVCTACSRQFDVPLPSLRRVAEAQESLRLQFAEHKCKRQDATKPPVSDGASPADERFQSGAHKYAAYLDTPEGRLRSDLAFANLQEFLPQAQAKDTLCALDLGGGSGATAVRLARLGFQVTLLDSSPEMLDIARSVANQAAVTEKIILRLGDAAEMGNLFPAGSFDVVVCHNVLEYVDDPGLVLWGAARALRDSSAILSVLVRNQAGEVLKAAIQAGDLGKAEKSLAAEWGQESLYGGRARLFVPDNLRSMLKGASLEMVAERGVRVLADYLPPSVSRSAEYERIFELEWKLGRRPEFAAVARYAQHFARCQGPAMEDRA
jgi:S-adenosylmethionine-dependent methyltransferase